MDYFFAYRSSPDSNVLVEILSAVPSTAKNFRHLLVHKFLFDDHEEAEIFCKLADVPRMGVKSLKKILGKVGIKTLKSMAENDKEGLKLLLKSKAELVERALTKDITPLEKYLLELQIPAPFIFKYMKLYGRMPVEQALVSSLEDYRVDISC